jgi:hypothetical protein
VSSEPPAAPSPPGGAPQPLFYQKPWPLDATRHAAKRLQRGTSFAFASHTNSVVLTTAEFAPALRFYPIVFTAQDPAMPIALLGVSNEANLFVDAGGAWRAHTYVPAYVRRYPFAFIESADRKSFTLCIDEASSFVTEGEGEPFFVGGKPSTATEQALRFCTEFQSLFQATRTFTDALVQEKLLIERQADFRSPAGQQASLSGFRIVDEQKFAQLPDATFLDWRKRGYVHLVHAHLFSLANLTDLFERSIRPA